MIKALVICAVILALAIVVGIIIVVVSRQLNGPAKNRELRQLREELSRAENTLLSIRDAADTWKDVDSVLATEVRQRYDRYYKTIRSYGRNDVK